MQTESTLERRKAKEIRKWENKEGVKKEENRWITGSTRQQSCAKMFKIYINSFYFYQYSEYFQSYEFPNKVIQVTQRELH